MVVLFGYGSRLRNKKTALLWFKRAYVCLSTREDEMLGEMMGFLYQHFILLRLRGQRVTQGKRPTRFPINDVPISDPSVPDENRKR